MAIDGFKHIIERPVNPVGTPATSGESYVNTSNSYDVAIAGTPFFLGPSKEYPYKRETAQYRKNQTDTQKEPGEQTLTGWWLRSQSSFHYGAGIRYEEPIQGPEVGMRFNKSAGVDVFNIGKVTLLPDVTKLATALVNAPLMVGGKDTAGVDVVIWSDDGTLYRTTAAGVTTTITWGGTGTILAIAQDGTNYYAANATGIYQGTLAGGTGTSIFTHPTAVGTVTSVTLGWAKQRLIAGINNYVYEVQPITTYNITSTKIDGGYNATITTSAAHNFGIGSLITVASVPATATATITTATNAAGVVTYTAVNTFAVGQSVTITGVTPTAYNITGKVTSATASNFTITDSTVTGVYTSGGTATYAPYNGTWSVIAVPNATSATFFVSTGTTAQAQIGAGTVALASNNNIPIYAHPGATWKWTGICEGPNAIYIAGYIGDSSTVYRLSLDTSGAVPMLTKALTAADMPKGEIIYALGSYIGKYMVFGTSKGIRIGTIDTSGFVSSGYITYGPLTVVTNGYDASSGTNLAGFPCKSITFNDRYAYCAVTNYIDTDGLGTTLKSGLIKIDLSKEIAPNQMAYATHLQVPSTAEAAAVCLIGTSNKLAIGVTGTGVYFQATTLVSTGYLQTGQIRFFTMEDKHFELVKLRATLPMKGSLSLTVVNSDNSVADIITVDNNFDFTQDITGMDTQDVYPKESVALKFTLHASTGQTVGQEDSFNGYQLKALPAVRRQRIITLPLLCYDFEGDRYNMAVGYEGSAAERLTALENIESGGDVIFMQDFTNDEKVRGVIESITFIRMTPPERRFKGFGGMILLQFRTI